MKTSNRTLYKAISLVLMIGITSTTFISFAEASDIVKNDYFLLNYEELLSEELSIQSKLSSDITREEFSELAIKLYSKASRVDFNLISKRNPFTDTNNKYVAMAYNVGIIKGISDTNFSPVANLTREEVASIIYNELKILGVNTSYDSSVEIVDESSISPWALEAVKFCVDNGILIGVNGDRINPKSTTTREQAISIISRVARKYSWIDQLDELANSSYKNIDDFSVPIALETDLLIYKPDNSDVVLRIYHNGIVDLNKEFDFKRLDKQILDILDKHKLYNYETSFMISEYVKDSWDDTNKTFVFDSIKYFKNASMLSSKPTSSYVEIKSGSYLELNIYE